MLFKVAEVYVQTLESSARYIDDSLDSAPDCTLSTPLNEICAESPPFSEPAHDENQSDSDIFEHDSENQ